MRRSAGLLAGVLCTLGLVSPITGLGAQSDTSGVRADSVALAPAARRISALRRTGAVVTSAYVGLGIGHLIIGDRIRFKRFALTQVGGAVALGIGAGLGVGSKCEDVSDCPGTAIVAGGLAFGGLAVYVGSRLWELVDVTVRQPPSARAPTASPKDSPSSRTARMAVAPVFSPRASGVVLAVQW